MKEGVGMIGYICDRCGKYYDWYEEVYENPKLNMPNNYKLIKAYREENKVNPIGYSANCLKFMFFEPVNENCATNKGALTGEIVEPEEGNNDLIMLCRDCMNEFMTNFITDFWEKA